MTAMMLLLVGAAWPCAGIFHDESWTAESDQQEALITVGDGQVTASYKVAWLGDAPSFGWVIPIKGEFVGLADGDLSVFDALEALTEPTIEFVPEEGDSGSTGCGCLGAENSLKGGDFGDTADTAALGLVAEGFTGTYSYVVLEATTSEALLGWLSDNGWSVGESGPSVDAYISEGGYQWVAIGLLPDTGASEHQLLPPVDITYTGDDVRYPARMARYSMVEDVRTTVWVQSDHMVEPTGWGESTLGTIEHEPDYSGTDVFRMALGELSASAATYNVTWSGANDGGWLTRFDAYTPRELHTVDAVFTDADSDEEVETLIRLGYFEDSGSSAAWLLLPLVGLGWGLRRR